MHAWVFTFYIGYNWGWVGAFQWFWADSTGIVANVNNGHKIINPLKDIN